MADDKVLSMIERMQERQKASEARGGERGTSTHPPSSEEQQQQQQQQQQQPTQHMAVTVATILAAILTPPNPYTAQDVLNGVGAVKMLSEKVFFMTIPDTCASLQFVLNAYNRTSRYKAAPLDPPVPVPVVPAVPTGD